MLGVRGLQILNQILNSSTVINAKILANEYQVSLRTIKYDLKKIKNWFNEHGVQLIVQPRKGYWIECEPKKLLELRNELFKLEHTQLYSNQETRVNRSLVFLGFSNRAITAENIANEFTVSRNTILNDIRKVSDSARRWGVELLRIKRQGYSLVGEEIRVRRMLEHLIMESMNNYEVYRLTEGIMGNGDSYHFYHMLDQQIHAIYQIVEKRVSHYFDEGVFESKNKTDILTLILRMTISLKRMQLGYTMGGYQLLDRTKLDGGYDLKIVDIVENVYHDLSFPLLENEYTYCFGKLNFNNIIIDPFELTEQIIQFVSEKENLPFANDSKLHDNLFAHLSLRMGKNQLSSNDFNPMNLEIKQQHPLLFQHVYQACEKFISNEQIVQESFVSLIVLHFIVSYEEMKTVAKKVRALYVCSTGRGVARLIKHRLETHITNVQMVAYCSIMDVERMCREYNIDLIISIFPIETSKQVIVISTLPQDIDYQMIQEKVDQILDEIPADRALSVPDDIVTIPRSGEAMTEEIILKGFEVYDQIVEKLSVQLHKTRQKGLFLHILLMVNRYFYNKQYDLVGTEIDPEISDEVIIKLKKVLEKNQLFLQESEFLALLQYFCK